jgi:mono/diheme cytochrome c family protein
LKRNQLTIAFAFLLFALAALAQTSPSQTSLTANPVFQKNCAKCHGPDARGHFFGGPSLASVKATATSAEDLQNIIANGKGWFPMHRMPKFSGKLTPQDIDTLAEQIRASNK